LSSKCHVGESGGERKRRTQTPLTLPPFLLAFPCFAFALPPSKKVISTVIKRFHSHGQQLCKFIGKKKESFYIGKTHYDPKGKIILFWETAHLPLP